MKTTLDLPDELMRAVKIRAVHEHKKLKDTIAELIRRGIAASKYPRPKLPKPVKLRWRRRSIIGLQLTTRAFSPWQINSGAAWSPKTPDCAPPRPPLLNPWLKHSPLVRLLILAAGNREPFLVFRRAEATQRLQSCGCIRRRRLAFGSSRHSGFSVFRNPKLGRSTHRARDRNRISHRARHRVGI